MTAEQEDGGPERPAAGPPATAPEADPATGPEADPATAPEADPATAPEADPAALGPGAAARQDTAGRPLPDAPAAPGATAGARGSAASRPGGARLLGGWREAMRQALYGPGGFYRSAEGPAAHFRTSVHASPHYARAVARLLCAVDTALGRPDRLDFVDMAAGRGELVTGVLAALPGEVAGRVRAWAVEAPEVVASTKRPPGLDARVAWTGEAPDRVTGLLFANEWLDNVPLDVVEADYEGVPRRLLVHDDGTEALGDPVGGADAAWLARWWPLAPQPGLRAEIGRTRDSAWADARARVARGLAVAVDYGHLRGARPPFGTLTGFRDGRETAPVPDGRHDLTAHVALDACTASAPTAGTLCRQRSALRALGVRGTRPPLALASSDPTGYVRALAAAGEAAELTAHGGLGDFWWLLESVGVPEAGALLGAPLLVDVPDHEEQ